MRPGYDRVSTDTRRPPIPDLPVDAGSGLRHRAEAEGYAATLLGAVFALMLTIGVGVAFLYGPPHAPFGPTIDVPRDNK